MRRQVVVATIAGAAVLVAGPAFALWNASVNATSTTALAAAGVQAPTTAAANAASSTSMSVTVTGVPSSGVVPTAFRVLRGGTTVSGCDSLAINATCTDPGLAPGTQYTYAVYGRVGTNWVSTTSASAQGTTTAAPAWFSSAATSSTINAGQTASWTVVFTQPVSGVTTNNFTVTNTSGTAAGTLASATASGGTIPNTTWTVTSNTVAGSGGIRLDLANKTGIQDSGGTGLTNTSFPVSGGSGAMVTVNSAASVAITEVDRSGHSSNYSISGTSTGGGSITLTLYSSYDTTSCTAGTPVGTPLTVSGSPWTSGNVSLVGGSTYYVKGVMSSPAASSSVYSFVAVNSSNNETTQPTATSC
jgi:hypothetical protein